MHPKHDLTRSRWTRIKPQLLRVYRAIVVVAIVLTIRQHFDRIRIQGDAPIEVSEVQTLLPQARELAIDTGPRSGVFIYDAASGDIGYAVRTSPQADQIIGYAGPTDVLLVFGEPDQNPNPVSLAVMDPAEPKPLAEPTRKLLGLQVRHSWDTTRHIQWVVEDDYFMEFWLGRDWNNLGQLNLYDEYMEGVSGATLSSMGMARSIQYRVQTTAQQSAGAESVRFSTTDYGILISLVVGILFTFRSGWKKRKTVWTALKIAAFVYVGFLNGSLIAISVLTGYTAQGLAWQLAPGLVALVLLSFFLPFTTRRQPYCNQICPHGAAQQLLARYSPLKKRQISPSVAAGLRWLPWLLIVTAVTFLVLRLPLEFSHLEPFDAYLFRQSDWIPIGLAISSLIASAFVPMAYCKYGCPTGALLEFARSHGRADKFGRRDWAALVLLGLVVLLVTQDNQIQAWLQTPRWLENP